MHSMCTLKELLVTVVIPPFILHTGCDILPLYHGNKWGTKLPSCHLVEKCRVKFD